MRTYYVPTKCGRCIECRQQRQREWIVRLSEELRENNNALFVTLTFDKEKIQKIKGIDENDTATKAIRHFLERCRKLTKKSPKHWCCTELGEENGRIHLHGIFWCEKELILKCWQYGYVYIGEYVNEKTIMYITKYMLKINEKRPDFKGKVLSSAGIGQEMGLQLANLASQIKLNESQAAKNTAEANKIAGVDTEGQDLENKWQEIENRIQLSRENIEIGRASCRERV